MLDELHGLYIFINIELKNEYHQIRMKERDEWKLSLRLDMGYMSGCLRFDLTNTPNTFIRLMNHVLSAFIRRFFVVYFDNIFMYNERLEEYINHLSFVLDVLRNKKLYANLEKYTFYMDKVIFLGYVVSTKDIEMDENKMKAIKEWPS